MDIAAISDDEWLGLLIRGLEDGLDGIPGGPPPDVQARFVGWSGEAAMRECYPFYQLVKRTSGSLSDQTVLDFGVGWGRLIRIFAKDVSRGRLYGVDVDPEIIQVCSDTGVPGQLQVIDPHGELPFVDGSLDIAYAYSVFSHLAEEAALHWFAEFNRAVRPGGLVVFTTQGTRFLQLCRAIRRKDERTEVEESINTFFEDPDAAQRTFDAGDFAYTGTGGSGVLTPDFYGWAAIPTDWIKRQLAGFTIEQMVDDPTVLDQVIFVLRRGGASDVAPRRRHWLPRR